MSVPCGRERTPTCPTTWPPGPAQLLDAACSAQSLPCWRAVGRARRADVDAGPPTPNRLAGTFPNRSLRHPMHIGVDTEPVIGRWRDPELERRCIAGTG